jgi:hypothetical protein
MRIFGVSADKADADSRARIERVLGKGPDVVDLAGATRVKWIVVEDEPGDWRARLEAAGLVDGKTMFLPPAPRRSYTARSAR